MGRVPKSEEVFAEIQQGELREKVRLGAVQRLRGGERLGTEEKIKCRVVCLKS